MSQNVATVQWLVANETESADISSDGNWCYSDTVCSNGTFTVKECAVIITLTAVFLSLH